MKRLVAFVAVAALMMGTVAGLSSSVYADQSDTIVGSVSINCPVPATVELNGGDAEVAFAPITNIISNPNTSTDPGAIKLKVDMGCYWGSWQVNATATRFTSTTTHQTFSANRLSLVSEGVDSYALDPFDDPLWFDDVLEPDASDAHFSCNSSTNPLGPCGEEILATDTNLLTWILEFLTGGELTGAPAPFVTEASYTGVLSNVPFLWGNNTYTSTITVELAYD